MNLKKIKKDFFALEAILIVFISVHLIFGTASYVIFANEESSTSTPEVLQEETPALLETASTTTEENITTGDAGALTLTENTVNTNDISTNNNSEETENTASSTEESINTASTTLLLVIEEEDEVVSSSTTEEYKEENSTIDDTFVENNNEVDIENTIVVSAETGTNEGGDGGTIQTGNAYAEAQLVNLANLNLINSTGFFSFLSNLFDGGIFDIDLRNHPFFSESNINTNGPCTTGGCAAGGDLDIENNNRATLTNNVEVYAGTGNNLVGEDGSIKTGNAYATANIINVANTNIINSNYLFLIFNSLGDWGGDLVFPSQDIFSGVLNNSQGGKNQNTSTQIENNNSATVSNNASVSANTGGNSAEEGSVETGTAVSEGAISNVINTNITSNEPFFTMIRLNGDWSGTIYGLPEGMSWEKDGDMIYVYSTTLLGNTKGSSYKGVSNETQISNNNTGSIQNNVSVTANTGGNIAGDNGSLQTGNAYASANIINVLNTNIIGRNVLFSIFNVLGDWSGDISFGRPDLWIGGIANIKNPNPTLNQEIEYRFKVVNNGDLESTNTQLEIDWPEELKIDYSNFGYAGSEGEDVYWGLGSIKPGEEKEVYIRSAIAELPYGVTDIPLTAEVSSNERDNNYEDNKEFLTFRGHRAKDLVGGEGPVYTAPPMLRVEKFASATSTTASSTIDYKIIITNMGGGSAYDAALVDTLKDEEGNIIHEELWEFGEIFGYEEITVEYSVVFNEDTREGTYTNFATVYALGGHPEFKYGYYANSKTAQTEIFVQGAPKPDVPEASSSVEESAEASEDEILPAIPFFEEETIKREILDVSEIKEEASENWLLEGLPYHELFIPKLTDEEFKGDFSQGAYVASSVGAEEEDSAHLPAVAVAVLISVLGATRTKESKWLLL